MKKHFKTNIDYDISLYKSSSELPQAWHSLIPDGHFLQAKNLKTTEDATLPHVSYCYALASIDGQAVAAAYFQLLHIKREHLNEAAVSGAARMAWTAFTATIRPSLLVAGHLFRHDVDSFYTADGIAPFDAYKLHQAMIKEAMRVRCASAVLVKDVAPELVSYFQNYAPEYMLLRNDISMELNIAPEWETIKDYEKALKHKYAQRFRKVRAHWDSLQIRELTTEEVWKEKEIIYNLYKGVSERQTVRLGNLSKDFIPLLKQQSPDELKVWLAYEGDMPVAFFSGWAREDVFDMFYIGFDYSRNDALQLYFNILFFSVEQAIVLRKQKLILGRTALEAKARLGCKPEYLSTFLYIKNGLVRNAVGRLQQQVSGGEGEWENRHPFK